MNKSLIKVEKVVETCDPNTYEPSLLCNIKFAMRDGCIDIGEGATTQVLYTEFCKELFAQISEKRAEYDALVETIFLIPLSVKYDLGFDLNQLIATNQGHKREIRYISDSWVFLKQANKPTIWTIAGERKENKTIKTEVVVPHSCMNEEYLTSETFKTIFQQQQRKLIEEYHWIYFYYAFFQLVTSPEGDVTYTLCMRGC